MDLQEIADRIEIHELLARYGHTLDERDWDGFRALFTRDARLDFTAFGGPAGDVETMIAFLQPVLAAAAATHHMATNIAVDLTGDRADVRSTALVPMAFGQPDGGTFINFSGLWYRDHLVRTPEGWRIHQRVQKKSWTFGGTAPSAGQLQ